MTVARPADGTLDAAPLKREVKRAPTGSSLEMHEILSYSMAPNVGLDAIAPALKFGAHLGAPNASATSRDDYWQRQCDNIGGFLRPGGTFRGSQTWHTQVTRLSPIAGHSRFSTPCIVRIASCASASGCSCALHRWRICTAVTGGSRHALPRQRVGHTGGCSQQRPPRSRAARLPPPVQRRATTRGPRPSIADQPTVTNLTSGYHQVRRFKGIGPAHGGAESLVAQIAPGVGRGNPSCRR
jgi:hypothetical protein